jgi:hypothetical protein
MRPSVVQDSASLPTIFDIDCDRYGGDEFILRMNLVRIARMAAVAVSMGSVFLFLQLCTSLEVFMLRPRQLGSR